MITAIQKVESVLSRAVKERLWGEVTVQFKNGDLILVKTTIQEKAEEHPNEYRR